jgi:tripartite-type tricarboxylate transporter receptor subunit TctC
MAVLYRYDMVSLTRCYTIAALLLIVSVARSIGGLDTATAEGPGRPIELVVSAAEGSGSGDLALLISRTATRRRLLSFVIVNKPGAGGAEALLHVKGKRGDAHTLVMAGSEVFTLPLQTGVPFHWKELTPIARIAFDRVALWGTTGVPHDPPRMIFGPPDLPGEVVARYVSAVGAVHDAPGFREELRALGMKDALAVGGEFLAWLETAETTYRDLLAKHGLLRNRCAWWLDSEQPMPRCD